MSKITICGKLLFLIVLVFMGTAGTKNCKKDCKKYLESKEMVTYITYRFFEEPPQELSDIWGFRVSAVDEVKNWSILQNSKKEPLEGAIMFKKMVKRSLKEKPYEFWVNGIKVTDKMHRKFRLNVPRLLLMKNAV